MEHYIQDLSREKGGRGLISCEGCVRTEENNLGYYIKNSIEKLIEGVKAEHTIEYEDTLEKGEYKEKTMSETERLWREKKMYGQFIREMPETTDETETWSWLRKSDFKVETEAMLCAAQEQAIRTNYVKHKIDGTATSPMCRMCGKRNETVSHIVSECSKLAQKEYKRRHDNVARIVHWKLCGLYNFKRSEKWYEHKPEGVLEDEHVKLLWDVMIQCDRHIDARRPDIVVVKKKERNCVLVDVSIPGDIRVSEKEQEKIDKYEELSSEVKKLWEMRKVRVVPIVVGALGSISKKLQEHVKELDVEVSNALLQKTALLGTARILRKVLDC